MRKDWQQKKTSPHPLESFLRESAGRLCLDRPEAETACEQNRSPDQVRCHTLPSVLLADSDHLDGEHLVRADLLKDMLVFMPELVMDSLNGVVAGIAHVLELLLQAQAELVLVARVVDCRAHRSTCSSVVGNPEGKKNMQSQTYVDCFCS